MDSFELKGEWWLPDNPSRIIAGIIKYNPREMSVLELFGSFDEDLSENKNEQVILGVVERARPVTLLDCNWMSRAVSFSDFPTGSFRRVSSKYSVHTIFIGHHFARKEDILFESMEINYQYLEEWSSSDERWKTIYLDSISPVEPQPIEVSAHLDQFLVRIKHYFHTELQTASLSIAQSTYINIKTPEKLHFDDSLIPIHILQVFLVLAMGRATFPRVVRGQVRSGEIPVSVYYPVGLRNPKNFSRTDALISLQDIHTKFETCLSNWFSKAEKLYPIYNLYASTVLNEEIYIEHRFLFLVQAFEAYHSRMYDLRIIGDEEHRQVLQILINAIPHGTDKKLRKRIEDSLQFSNRPSLRGRFSEIWKIHKEAIKTKINNREQYDSFCNEVVNTRNYLTHYNPDIKSEAKTDPISLVKMSNRLQFLIEICLLSELGFSNTEIVKIISRHQRYKFY